MKLAKNLACIFAGVICGTVFVHALPVVAQSSTNQPSAEEMRLFTDAVQKIKQDYVKPVDDTALMTAALKGMASSLDAHSWYLDKTDYEKFRESTLGSFAGLGIEISLEDGLIKVIAPIEDTPAFRAGIRPGDLITRIDGNPVRGMTLDQAVKKMRGDVGTQVTLTVFRKTEDRTFPLTVTRDIINAHSVKTKILAPGYAYIRITSFQERTIPDLATTLSDIARQQPNLRGVILDLRNNGGGLIQSAVGVAGAFLLQDSVVVSTKGQLPDSNRVYRDTYDNYRLPSFGTDPLKDKPAIFKTVPMLVLTNAYSASASEIVAGALQDQHRALIAGKTTYGKGSVQTVQLVTADTALSVTTAYYYTPAGRSIQNKGIRPDISLNQYADGDPDDVFVTREIDSENHLANTQDPNDRAEQAKHEQDRLAQLRALEQQNEHKSAEQRKKERDRKPVEFGSNDDFMLQQALKKLEGKSILSSKSDSEPAATAHIPATAAFMHSRHVHD